MAKETSPEPESTSQGTLSDDQLLQEQLARYANDMRELFAERQKLEGLTKESEEQIEARSREVAALNEFLRQRLSELLEIENAYQQFLTRLEQFIAEGRKHLEEIRNTGL